MKKEVPEPVRRILEMMLGKAIERCHREGIPLAVFRDCLLDEQRRHPEIGVGELLRRSFQRVW